MDESKDEVKDLELGVTTSKPASTVVKTYECSCCVGVWEVCDDDGNVVVCSSEGHMFFKDKIDGLMEMYRGLIRSAQKEEHSAYTEFQLDDEAWFLMDRANVQHFVRQLRGMLKYQTALEGISETFGQQILKSLETGALEECVSATGKLLQSRTATHSLQQDADIDPNFKSQGRVIHNFTN